MAITGAVLAILGATLVIVATAWEMIDVATSRRDLAHTLVKWENWHTRWKESEAERVENGFVLKLIPPDREEPWKAERDGLMRELADIDPRESQAYSPLTPADLERAMLTSAWKTLSHQGMVAAFGGLITIAGAVCSIAAL